MSNDMDSIAATLAAGMLNTLPIEGIPAVHAVKLFYAVLDELKAEHDRRLQQKHTPSVQRQVMT